MNKLEQARTLANEIYQAGLKRVKGYDSVYAHLSEHPLQGSYKLIAFGKAGSSMALGALAAMGDQISDGLVITKHDHTEDELRANKHIRCIESDHPVPGQASIDAGHALLEYIQSADADAQFLILISGGASSLIEVLPPGMTLETLSQLTDTLLSIGFDITQMNQVRRAVSCIKGGRLASYIDGRQTHALLISDVPGDDPAVIGSGPLTPVDEDIRSIELPATLDEILRNIELVEPPSKNLFQNIDQKIIATLDHAKEAAATRAAQEALPVTVDPTFLEGDAGKKAEQIATQLCAAEPGIYIWGGETAVTLPSNPGRGGRNQHFALTAAKVLSGREDVVLISVGTDGTDGPTQDAGGIVDGLTIARGMEKNLDADAFLQRADAGNYLEATGDLVTTGPTGTNVMDLVIGIKL